jgi:predicted kinase
MSIVYLVSGQIGSGKTTYSKSLEEKTGAIRFSPDEWMLKLYPQQISNEEFDYYFFKCCEIAWSVAKKLIKKNLDVILDFGFWTRLGRNSYIEKIKAADSQYKLFYIYCPEEIIRERLKKRNENLPEDCFHISEEAFNFFSPGFEPPGKDELFEIIDNS